MTEDDTHLYDISIVKKKLISETLDEVYKSLEERGYNPINQIVGYLISGDPGYISNYQDSRNKLQELDRSEITAVLLKDYLKKWDV